LLEHWREIGLVFNTQTEMLKTFTGFQSYGGEQKFKASLNPEAATDRADGAESVAAVDRNFPFVTTSGATDGDKLMMVWHFRAQIDTYERRTSKESDPM
jgi:hypothetical protein